MTRKMTEPTTTPRERAFMVGVELRGEDNFLNLDESLAELRLLRMLQVLSGWTIHPKVGSSPCTDNDRAW
jgi:hypothetical protein